MQNDNLPKLSKILKLINLLIKSFFAPNTPGIITKINPVINIGLLNVNQTAWNPNDQFLTSF